MKKALLFSVFVSTAGILSSTVFTLPKKAETAVQPSFTKTCTGLKRDLANAD